MLILHSLIHRITCPNHHNPTHHQTGFLIMQFPRFLSATTATAVISAIAASSAMTPLAMANPSAPRITAQGQSAPQGQSAKVRWQPKRNMGSVGSTLSGGRRGQAIATCEASPSAPPTRITLLVPKGETRVLTATAAPTVHWHTQTSQPLTMTLVLADPAVAQPLFTQKVQAQQSGIAHVRLPATLQPGQRYRWTVLANCANGADIHARAFIEHTREPADAAQRPGLTPLDRAAFYAENGIWYDALTAVLEAQQQNPAAAQVAFKSLLQSVDQTLASAAEIAPGLGTVRAHSKPLKHSQL
jgi:hypothetical protein